MRIVVGIPARMNSSRFPGKPLYKILGIPMIEHVYKRSKLSNSEVFITTCDDEIKEEVEGFGGKVIMTSSSIKRPGLRVAKACESLNLDNEDIVVVVQGDEPLVSPKMIDIVVKPLLFDRTLYCSLLITKATKEDWNNTNSVKAIKDIYSNAIYFSRAPIPSMIRTENIPLYKQVGVFAFKYGNMKDFNNLLPTPIEIAESVEMMRALEYGKKIKLVETVEPIQSVDTEEDRKLVERMMIEDKLCKIYLKKE